MAALVLGLCAFLLHETTSNILIFINAFFRCCKRTRHEQLMEAVEDQEHHLAADLSDVSANYGRPFFPTESRTPVNTIYRKKS